VNGAGPAENACDAQTIKSGVAVESFVDLDAHHRLAETIGRQCIELARAAIGAIAVREFAAMNGPLGIRHRTLPRDRLRRLPWLLL
jgi:hypothetical protein